MGKFLHARLRKNTVLTIPYLTLLDPSILYGETISHYLRISLEGSHGFLVLLYLTLFDHSMQNHITLYFHWIGGGIMAFGVLYCKFW